MSLEHSNLADKADEKVPLSDNTRLQLANLEWSISYSHTSKVGVNNMNTWEIPVIETLSVKHHSAIPDWSPKTGETGNTWNNSGNPWIIKQRRVKTIIFPIPKIEKTWQ